jgi:hypothetical protein
VSGGTNRGTNGLGLDGLGLDGLGLDGLGLDTLGLDALGLDALGMSRQHALIWAEPRSRGVGRRKASPRSARSSCREESETGVGPRGPL